MELLDKVYEAKERLKNVAIHTPLMKNVNLSEEFFAQVSLKREDLQPVRSYKLRGAYNKIVSFTEEEKSKGVVCASAGNHVHCLFPILKKEQPRSKTSNCGNSFEK